MQLTVMNLKKHWNNNTVGECIGVNEEAAAWILKHDGGDVLAKYDPDKETVVLTRDKDGCVTAAKASPKKQ